MSQEDRFKINTREYFRIGRDGLGYIDTIRVYSQYGNKRQRIVSYTVQHWLEKPDDITKDSQRYTWNQNETFHINIRTDKEPSRSMIESLCVSNFLNFVGKGIIEPYPLDDELSYQKGVYMTYIAIGGAIRRLHIDRTQHIVRYNRTDNAQWDEIQADLTYRYWLDEGFPLTRTDQYSALKIPRDVFQDIKTTIAQLTV